MLPTQAVAGNLSDGLVCCVVSSKELQIMAGIYQLRVTTGFCAAHQLRGYDGPCARLHGHNWKIETEVSFTQLDDIGIGLDFKTVKDAIKGVTDRIDHRNLNDIPPFDAINPTAENLVAWLYREVQKALKDQPVQVSSLTVWETPSSSVCYREAL